MSDRSLKESILAKLREALIEENTAGYYGTPSLTGETADKLTDEILTLMRIEQASSGRTNVVITTDSRATQIGSGNVQTNHFPLTR